MIWLAALVLNQDADAFYEDATHDLRLLSFATGDVRSLDSDRIAFEGTGDPLIVELRSQGLRLEGKSIKGICNHGSVLVSATLDGGVTAALDTAQREAWQKEKGLLKVAATTQTKTSVKTQSVTYTDGKFEMPAPGAVVIHEEGLANQVPFREDITITSTAGHGAFDLTTSVLRTLDLSGPLTFALVRTETKGGQDTVSKVSGTADALHFGASDSGGTLTLSGHVQLDGDRQAFFGSTHADSVKITVDKTYQPTGFEAKGVPASTRVRQGGGI